jgi:3'-phosphoadenosine 5'-phosphosulfate sulfotransferase (PAPS reductase)/FAD synthetase
VKHVVALSGGKDSTALALRLKEVEPREYVYVCTPTGDELPEMFAHWRRLGDMLGAPILPVTSGQSLSGLIERQNALPNDRMRWCTRMLKIEPYRAWLLANRPCVSDVGLRADEEGRAGGAYADIDGVEMRFPLREWGWSEADVWAYLDQRGVRIPERTDCARCYHQRLGEWWRLWREHPELYADAEAQEQATGHTFRNPKRDTWPAALRELRAEFERGKAPADAREMDLFRGGSCRVCTL